VQKDICEKRERKKKKKKLFHEIGGYTVAPDAEANDDSANGKHDDGSTKRGD
jgi:hypothetical protein